MRVVSLLLAITFTASPAVAQQSGPISASIAHAARTAAERTSPPTSSEAKGALFWSGRVAGLSMGFSFLAPALLEARPLDVPSSAILAGFSCCVGFVITILGEQQPFTE